MARGDCSTRLAQAGLLHIDGENYLEQHDILLLVERDEKIRVTR